MGHEEKTRENYLRRQAKRLGLALKKSRAKKWNYDNQGDYMLIDPYTNCVFDGAKFELSIDDVAEILNEYEEELKAQN